MSTKYGIRMEIHEYNLSDRDSEMWLNGYGDPIRITPKSEYFNEKILLVFDTEQAAHEYLVNNHNLSKNNDGSYSFNGVYYAGYNEYARPDYFIEKLLYRKTYNQFMRGNEMFKIKHDKPHKHNFYVSVITTECGREFYCSRWNGEKFLDCWEYSTVDGFKIPIDVGQGQYIYGKHDEVNDTYEILGFELI